MLINAQKGECFIQGENGMRTPKEITHKWLHINADPKISTMSFKDTPTVLITGGCGFIVGSHTVYPCLLTNRAERDLI